MGSPTRRRSHILCSFWILALRVPSISLLFCASFLKPFGTFLRLEFTTKPLPTNPWFLSFTISLSILSYCHVVINYVRC
ncbi:uncharacterized protein F4812DRAFT_432057 [Daldinia caldariorum]|uniref:uncharacterized protein n=1 Tax=Daldinia caldariorum TaxID=326644 RepID=UPI0020085D78|nr:uncharacterized protein F4812DRAFT_432057 [Daldinia caldariorum]KAI1467291.1 hypothetical protein F4812DRAFT_432057 [Daldinia caldariorum]